MSDSENLVKKIPHPAEVASTFDKEQQKEKTNPPNLTLQKAASEQIASLVESVDVLQEKGRVSQEYEYDQLGSDEDSKPQSETIMHEGPQVWQDTEELFSEHDLQTPISSDTEDFFEDSVEESEPLLNSEERAVTTPSESNKEDENNFDEEKKEEKTPQDSTKEKMAKEEEEKQCRICYGGLDDEPSFGKLISPCKCKGTMKYVHLQCLNSWRLASGGKSFFECDSCHYKYNFQRTTMAKVATNPLVLTLFSLLVFVFIVFLAGFPVKIALRTCDIEDFDVWDDDLYDTSVITFEELAPFLSMTNIDLFHMLLGLIMVGIIGFLHFLVSTLAFGGPIPIIGFGYRNGGFRVGNRGDDRFGGGILLILVAIGTVKAFWTVYTIVRNMSRRSLEAVGAAILEVHD